MEGPPVQLSEIQTFYKDSTVFLTGATGFIGKLFLEKVLRALPVKKVYILVRQKKNVPAEKRYQDIFESPAFDPLKRSDPKVFEKVAIMEGDCALPLLGLSPSNIEIILQQVNVIFHCAATVRFNEHLKRATRTNVRATKDLVDLAKRMDNLKTFVYVGTVFSNSYQKEIKEEVYPSKISAENLIAVCEGLDDECLTIMTKTLVGKWPNTYTFTKQVTEEYINREGANLPICITRPAVVISTAAEPLCAFVDNFYTLAGFVIANGVGFNRICYDYNVKTDIVPADYVVNECIAAGWHTAEIFRRRRTETPVFNISSGLDNPISQDEIYGLCDYYARLVPTPKLVTYPMYFRTSCKYNYLIWRFLLHTVMAQIIDGVLKIQGKEPMYVEATKKLHSFQDTYEFFVTNEFYIHVENTHKLLKRMSHQDRELFNFNLKSLNWDNYFPPYIKGLRLYLLKETLDTVTDGIKVYQRVKWVMVITLVFAAIIFYVLGKIFLFKVLPFVLGIVAYFLRILVC